MKGYQQVDGSVIWEDGSQTWTTAPYPLSSNPPVPPGGWNYALKATAWPVISVAEHAGSGVKQQDGSIIWYDGSRTYPLIVAPPGSAMRKADSPGSWPYVAAQANVVGDIHPDGWRQVDSSVIWKDGSRTYLDATPDDPPGKWPFPPPQFGVPVFGAKVPKPVPKVRPKIDFGAPPQGQVVSEPPVAHQEVAPVDFVVWTGPVNGAQAKGATIAGITPLFITCTGDGTPTCGELATNWKDADGRILPRMLSTYKIDVNTVQHLYAGAFSAGGQIWKRAMESAADRALITAAFLSDAGYEASWADEKAKIAPFIEGYVGYALDCIANGRVFVWTASSNPNPSQKNPGTVYPAGVQIMASTIAEIEKRSGRTFVDVTVTPEAWPWSAALRAPVQVWRCEQVIFADYGSVYHHDEHPTVLAPAIWAAYPAILASAQAQTATPGGTTATGYVAQATGWWGKQTTPVKVGVGVGAGILAYLGLRKKG